MAFAVQIAKGIFDLVRDDLALVEQEIAAQNGGAIEPVAEISSYLREGGGKRLRPALLLLAAGAAGYRGPSAIRLGAVVEMIHSATLVHDDVIDGANTRRGRPSTNARWGNHMSVLAGDWLYMQSFEMALRERNFAILDILIDLTQNMVEGELLQLTRLGQNRSDRNRSHRAGVSQNGVPLQRLRAARRGAGRAAEARGRGARGIWPQRGPRVSAGGRSAGFHGVARAAWQAGAERFEGRQSHAAADFRARGERHGAQLDSATGTDMRMATARRLVAKVLEERGFRQRAAGANHEARAANRRARARAKLAREYVERAKACLEELPDTEYRRALLAVPDFILEREN